MDILKQLLGLFSKSKESSESNSDVDVDIKSSRQKIKSGRDTVIIVNGANDELAPKVADLYKATDKAVDILSAFAVDPTDSSTVQSDEKDGSDFGHTHLDAAKEARKVGNIEEALQHYEHAEKLYKKSNNTFQRAKILLIMSILANVQKKNNVESQYIEREADFRNTALLLYIKSLVSGEYNRFQPQEFVELGALESRMGNYDNALEYYEIAQKLCEKTGDKKILANVFRLTGIMEGKANRSGRVVGKAYLKKAQNIYNDIKDEIGVALTFEALGDMGRAYKEYSDALDSYKKAWEKYDSVGNARRYFIAWHLYNTYDLLENALEAQRWENMINSMFDTMPKEHQNYILKSRKRKTENEEIVT